MELKFQIHSLAMFCCCFDVSLCVCMFFFTILKSMASFLSHFYNSIFQGNIYRKINWMDGE